MGAPSGWVTLIFTTLGAGVLGSVITSYATQARARLDARVAFSEAVRKADELSIPAALSGNAGHAALKAQLAEIETRAQVAGIPRAYVELYRDVMLMSWVHTSQVLASPTQPRDVDNLSAVYGRVSHRAAKLLLQRAWHPWRTHPLSWYRMRRFRLVLRGADPVRFAMLDEAERRLRNQERRLAKAGRAAKRRSSRTRVENLAMSEPSNAHPGSIET